MYFPATKLKPLQKDDEHSKSIHNVYQSPNSFMSASKLYGLNENSVIFPKDKRFPKDPSKVNGSDYFIYSTLSQKTTTPGYGKKDCFYGKPYLFPNAIEYPSPNQYEIKSQFSKKIISSGEQYSKGKSFGVPFKCYEKVYIENSQGKEQRYTKYKFIHYLQQVQNKICRNYRHQYS